MQLSAICEAMFAQFALEKSQGKASGVNRRSIFAQQIRDAADVVFVTVGQNDAKKVERNVREVTEIGRDEIDTQQIIAGEHDTGVDYDPLASALKQHGIHAEFAQAAE